MKKISTRRPPMSNPGLLQPLLPGNSTESIKLTVREPLPEDTKGALLMNQENLANDQLATESKNNSTTIRAEVTSLGEAEIDSLLKRIPEIKHDPTSSDVKDFFMREKSLKAPITAEIIAQEFPPPVSLEKPAELIQEEKELMGSELMVIRYLPEGEISDASVPYLSITFSQPMVSVSSVEHVELNENIPVNIEPLPKNGGKFKWLGTKTLIYEPLYRFDMSTKYNVTIKAGTQSKIGGILKHDVKFSFETPKLYLRDYLPKHQDSFPLNEFPIFYLEFDQEINPENVLPFVNVDTSLPMLKLVSNDGRSETPSVKEYIIGLMKELNLEKKASNIYYSYKSKLENSPKGRHLWFTFSTSLNHRIESLNVTVKAGVKGLEGPLPTEKPSSFIVKNYPAFTITQSYEASLLPMQPLTISFSNNIDLEKFDENTVRVEPEIERMELNPNGNYLTISGKIKGKTNYKVTFNENTFQDVWGQHLSGDKSKTFHIGNAAQSLQALQSGVMVLDPTVNTKPSFSVVTMNLQAIHCRVFQVEPNEYNSNVFNYNAYSNTNYTFPGKQVLDATINTNGQEDEPCDTDIDLSLLLQYPKENIGQLFIVVEPEKTSWKGEWNYRPIHQAWIQVTKLAVDAIYDSSDCTLYYWVNSLMDGSIMKENISVKSGSISSTPDRESGIGVMKRNSNLNSNCSVIAYHGNDKCFIPDVYLSRHYPHTGISYQIFNDRGLYKPGETVSIKGIVRTILRDPVKKNYSVGIPKDSNTTSEFTILDSRSSKYHSGSITLTSNGTFDFTFKIPDNANLGNHTINFSPLSMSHSFQVQEFRTPEFNSSCSVQPGNYVVNGPAALCTTRAQYYSGGGISGGTCSYIIRQNKTSYIPPNRSGYSFGKSTASPFGSWFGSYLTPSFSLGVNNLSASTTFQGMTDMNGEHQIALLFEESNRIEKVPISISIESTVQDINRQTISSSTSFVVHPCKYYCGLKFGKQFTKPNTPVMVSLLTTNINGELIPNIDMDLTVTTHVDVKKGFKYVQEKVEILKKTFKSNSDSAIEFPIQFENGGAYDFHVSIRDPESGLQNSCSSSLYVTGGKNAKEERVGKVLQQKPLLLIPDKNEYSVGDKATILIQSQLDGHLYGVLSMCMDGIFEKPIPIEIDPSNGCTEFSFIITKHHIPNVKIMVEMSGSESRVDHVGNVLNNEPKQPAFASGNCTINVSKLSHELQVDVKPEKQFLTPGSSTFIQVTVKDALTQQFVRNSEVCIVAVDEAVLSLTGYRISNPLDTFVVSRNSNCTSRWSLRSNVFVKRFDDIRFNEPPRMIEKECAKRCCCKKSCAVPCCSCCGACKQRLADCTEGEMDAPQEDSSISVRSNFNPLAIFSPKAMTDENGIATVNLTLPDNLTKYRITAVALKDESHFGISESSMTAQLPLNIRPSLPRFLNFGDCAEFTCVLQNQTLMDLNVNVAIRFTNLTLLDESKRGLNVKIPAMSRHELRFPMMTEKVGIARFQVGVSIANRGINFGDAVEKEIRVFTPATTEGFATYGEVDNNGNVFQPIRAPENVYPQFGGINITTSSTALSSLTDAFIYLYSYPFECCEQLASKILTIVALKDVLQAFNVPDLPSETQINDLVQKSIQLLESRQHPSGAYSYWSYYNHSLASPYVTCHVAHSLARAKKAGYSVNSNTISKLLNVLKTIENYCQNYSEESIRSIKAYAYYCAALLDDREVKDLAEKLYKQVRNGNLEYLAWIATTLYLCYAKTANSTVKEIIETLCKRVNETAQTANFITSYGDVQTSKLIMLHSDRRTDGICLEALITITPENTIIPKIVKGLLAHKKKGRWGNTQENSFILLALNTYFRTFEGVTPNFVTKLWLGDDYCGEQEFIGRSKDEKLIKIPMSYLIEKDTHTNTHTNLLSSSSSSSSTSNNSQNKTLIISKQGEGRLYYRIGMDYSQKNLLMDALEYGFQVERSYEHVTNAEHVKYDPERNCWRFKAGELVRVKLRLTNTSRRYHVALVDMLPAGLEPINPELKGTPSTAEIGSDNDHSNRNHRRRFYCWWRQPWYEHHNIRDERVEAFSSLLWEGIHEFNYVARATSIGSFVIPPAKAEEMYTPEIFGRSSTAFAEVYE